MVIRCLIILLLISGSTFADSPVNVHFYGTINDASCQIDSDSISVPIDLGTIYNKDLAEAGAASSWQTADVKLINCPSSLKSITAKFTGTPDSDDPTLYKNLEDAQSVSIELQDRNTQKVLSNNVTDELNVDGSCTAIFNLKARAKTVKGNATPGSIRSIIEITFSYQ